MRSRLLTVFIEEDSSQYFQVAILKHIAAFPERNRETETDRILSMMSTMSEEEVLKNL